MIKRRDFCKKRSTTWVGYKVHLTESCEPHLPLLITHVETTSAPVSDDAMTAPIHAELDRKHLLPTEHIVDTGYVDAKLLVESQRDYQIDLGGPTRKNYRWQASQHTGFDAEHFLIDWQQQPATCPQGQSSISWTPAIDNRKNEVIKIKFSTKDCQVCPSRSLCTQSSRHTRRTVTIRPHQQYLALIHRREQEKTQEFTQVKASRAGIEGTISKASSDDGYAPFSLHWAGENASATSGYCRCSQSGSQHRLVQWACSPSDSPFGFCSSL
jgi:transposase